MMEDVPLLGVADGVDSLSFKHIAKGYFRNICTRQTLKKKLPITVWLPKYSLRNLQSDAIAGLTVGLTVIPQGLAYARIAELPSEYGLYSAFMGCFVYCLLGSSKDITLGPTAIMSLMTAAFAVSPVENDPTYAIILTLMVGAVQLLMGILNLGIIVDFISYPVINGFTSAAAITIAFGQVKHILGVSNIPRNFLREIYYTFAAIPDTNVWDLLMGVASLIILYFLKKFRTLNWRDPEGYNPCRSQRVSRKIIWFVGIGANAIVVITAAGLAASLIAMNINGTVTITGTIKQGLPPFRVPSFSLSMKGNKTMSAGQILEHIGAGLGVVPLLGLVELIAIGNAFARQNKYKIDATQELVAIGCANIISSFVSSYPVTGSFSRTAVNSQSGVRTPAAGIFTGSLVLLALAVLTPLFYYIPQSALAAVIISAVLQMVDVRILLKLWKINKLDLVQHLSTFVSCLVIGIEYGILVGIGISLLMLMYPTARPQIKVLQKGVVIFEINQGIMFPCVEYLQEFICDEVSQNTRVRSVVLDCRHVSGIDFTAVQGISQTVDFLHEKGVQLIICGLKLSLLETLNKGEIKNLIISSTLAGVYDIIDDDDIDVQTESCPQSSHHD